MKIRFLIYICGLFGLSSCSEREFGPLVTGGGKPEPVRNAFVENLPGGAKISYNLPTSDEVLYVLAEYPSSQGGDLRTTVASVFTNYVVLDGFADETERTVKLFVVTRSEKRSEPVEVTIKPTKAFIHDVFESLRVQETFGGVNLAFENDEEDGYVIYTMVKNDRGEWVTYDRLYSDAKSRSYDVRGLESIPTEFAFFVQDQWKNHSDTLLTTLTPLFETELSKSLWKHLALPTDTYEPEFASWAITNLWNGTTAAIFYVNPSIPGLVLPNWFTLDLGQESRFSRIKVNQLSHNNAWMFASGAPKEFEIYGSNNPATDGSWDSWTLLGKFESIKPSNLPLGQLTSEDIATAIAGEDFVFDSTIGAYRYIRFKTNRTWAGARNVMIAELTMWGQPTE